MPGNEDPGGIMNAGTMTIVRSTISGNEGDGWGGIRTVGALTITASIVTGNEAYGEASNCAGLFTSGGYNLLGSDCADSATATDIAADDPLLRPLARIGGLTATMAPRPVSPATDAIPIGSELCPAAGTTDQRGLPRPREAGCEIGSVERQPTS